MIVRMLIASALLSCTALAQAEEVETLSETEATLRTDKEAVQWLPDSVTVVEKSELESHFRRDLEALEGMVPGLIVDRLNTTPRGAALSIRGVGSAAASKAIDPAVAVNIDGVYVGTHTGRMQVLFDFDRVEVARGPQTVFEGNPNLSGAINIERRRPTGEFDIDLRVAGTADDRQEMDAIVNLPAAGNFKAKLGIYWKDQGGDYLRNVFNGREENTEDYLLATAMFEWGLEDIIDLRYTFDTEDSDETSPALLNVSAESDLLCTTTANLPFPNCRRGIGNPELDSRFETAQNFSNERQFEGDYHTLRLDFSVGEIEATGIIGLRETDETVNLDLDASNADFYHVFRDQDYEQASYELTFTHDLSASIDYAFGFYVLNTEYNIFQREFHILKQLGDAGLASGSAAGEIQELTSRQKTDLQSAFGYIDYTINDRWNADLGVRYSQVERRFTHSPSRIRLNGNLSPLRTFIVGEETNKESLVSAGLSYKVDEEAMIYFRYSEGYLPGGFDENAMSAATGNSYGAETNRSVELGLKSDWWEDRLRVNVVYHQAELDNKLERINIITPTGDIESVLDNQAKQEHSGWEIEVASVPLPNLEIRTSFSWLDGKYDEFLVQDLAAGGVFINTTATPERSPDKQIFVSANYSLPIGPGTLHSYAGFRLISDYQTNNQYPEGNVDNWQAWDISVGYEWRDFVFRLFSNNVKNKEFVQNVVGVQQTDILPVTSGVTVPVLNRYTEYNQPRMTGLEVIYRPQFR